MPQDDRPTAAPPARPTSRLALFCWAMYDWANSSYSAVIQTFVFAAYFARQVAADEATGSAQWGNTISAAALAVAVAGPVLGAVADQGGRRKPWLAVFTLVAVLSTALMWFVEPGQGYLVLALVLLGVSTFASEAANIFYNAMLPGLAGRGRIGRWSGWAWGLGYTGGMACLLVALFGFVEPSAWFSLDRGAAAHVRATFVLVAVWYFVFALPLLLVTPDTQGTGKRLPQAARDGLRQLFDTLRHVRRYRHLVRFLIARMIYIDGLATVFAFGGVYAAGTFQMTERDVLMFGIALNVTAGLGAGAFAWIDDWLGSKRTILISLIGLIVPGTAILFAPTATWFWAWGMLLGVFVGPVQAASRSYMGQVAPVELQTQMFGLYALSGKATAFLGPLLVGWGSYLAGSQRVGMSTVIVFFVVGFVLMLTVPNERHAVGKPAG